MKTLPEPPTVYQRPKERWFENHIPSDNHNTVSVNKTLTAMWLMLNDRMMLPLPEKALTFGASERNTVDKMLSLFGDQLMIVWGNHCNKVSKENAPIDEWGKLMFKRWNRSDGV